MKNAKLILVILLMSILIDVSGQDQYTGVIRGVVRDEVSLKPLTGVNILVEGKENVYVTDEEGKFRIENLPVGRYNLKFSFTGFRSFEHQSLMVGKDNYLEIELKELPTVLGEVEITSNSFIDIQDVVSGKSFNIEQTNRIPANFFDPVRVATSFPGVVASHDQANNLVIRGNSPNTLLWRLEGINIVNPNHLSNAGTLADKPLQTGGGVNILSGQMLGDTRFLNGPMPVEYGDGFSSMDMEFRPGNNQKNEFTAQLSLIGLDFSAEGPISDKGGSYLLNYRYSTVGVLTNVIGLDFGGEAITFQDLAFNVETPIGEDVNLKLFGFGGLSSNYFRSNQEPDTWEIDKDSKDILYDEQVGLIGASIDVNLPSGSFSYTTGVSGSEQNRVESDYNQQIAIERNEQLFKNDVVFSNNLTYRNKVRNGYFRVGAFIDYNYRRLFEQKLDIPNSFQSYYAIRNDGLQIRPYADLTMALGSSVSFTAGLAYNKYNMDLDGTLEPRLSIFYDLDASKTLIFGYGRTGSQLALYSEELIPQSISDQFSTSWRQRLSADWTITAELYYQRLTKIPTSENGFFSYFNMIDFPFISDLSSSGDGRNYGIEFFTNKRLSDKYYLIAGGSLYESEYLLNNDWTDSQFNGNYTANITWGREVVKNNKTFGINARALYLGGFRRPEINENLSEEFGTTIFDYSKGYPVKNGDYFRIDFSINWKKNKGNYTRTFGIDIQNLFNIQNDGLSYFDVRSGEVLERPQLGTIPVILYRIDF